MCNILAGVSSVAFVSVKKSLECLFSCDWYFSFSFFHQALGKVGKVLKVYADGDLRVSVGNQIWTFNPVICTLLPQCQRDENNTLTRQDREDRAMPSGEKLHRELSYKATPEIRPPQK